jgi:hypothetical protein
MRASVGPILPATPQSGRWPGHVFFEFLNGTEALGQRGGGQTGIIGDCLMQDRLPHVLFLPMTLSAAKEDFNYLVEFLPEIFRCNISVVFQCVKSGESVSHRGYGWPQMRFHGDTTCIAIFLKRHHLTRPVDVPVGQQLP